MAQTLFDKIWDQHKIKTLDGGEDLIAIDRVFLHERTGSVALKSMLDAGRAPIRPEHVFCTMDHIVYIQSERCLLYTSPSPRDATLSHMPSSA